MAYTNKLSSILAFIGEKIGGVTMGTTATTLTGAIAEHESDIATINSNIATTPVKLDDANYGTDPRKYYYIDTSADNTPSTSSWFFIRCMALSGNNCFQMAFTMGGTTAKIYARSRGSTGTWGSWVTVI